MKCEWQAYVNLLPLWMRSHVDKLGKDNLRELRLRVGLPPELRIGRESLWLNRNVTTEDIAFTINIASKYSLWTASTSASGYITAQGGHRLGVCGTAVTENGRMRGIQSPTSVSLRVSRDFPGLASGIAQENRSILVIGKPGSGKTTFLRDMIRQKSDRDNLLVSVVDERQEIFPVVSGKHCYYCGKRTDVIGCCGKQEGIEAVLRSMTPQIIAVDEITAKDDCKALIEAGWCGVKLLATAHAEKAEDLLKRPVYKPIIESRIFDLLLVMHDDNTWHTERMIS